MDFSSGVFLKPLAETLQQFLDKPSELRPRPEDINVTMSETERNDTVLVHCIRSMMFEATDALINAGANLNLASENGVTPMYVVARQGNINLLEKLIKAGADVNAANLLLPCGTALFTAAHFGHLEAVKLLIAHGATRDFANKNGTTPFMRACQEGHTEICQYFLSLGVDVNHKNLNGMSPLGLAANRGRSDIVTILVTEYEANIEVKTSWGGTVLMLAAKRGFEKCVETLVTLGANVRAKDNTGRTAYQKAKDRGYDKLLRWLSAEKADTDSKKTDPIIDGQVVAEMNPPETTADVVLLTEGAAAVEKLPIIEDVTLTDNQQTVAFGEDTQPSSVPSEQLSDCEAASGDEENWEKI